MYEAGARLCRREGEIGILAAGARADLVAVEGDPFADITLLGHPEESLRLVVRAGRIAHDNRTAQEKRSAA